MAKLPLPERGQPLDLSYIYQMASVINDLSAQVSPSNYKYVTLDTPSSGKQSIKASEARIIGGFVSLVSSSTVNAANEKEFSYDFSSDFAYPPIATATIVNTGESPTEAGKDISLSLTSVTTSNVKGVVRFNTSGEVSVGVNIMLIGIPK